MNYAYYHEFSFKVLIISFFFLQFYVKFCNSSCTRTERKAVQILFRVSPIGQIPLILKLVSVYN